MGIGLGAASGSSASDAKALFQGGACADLGSANCQAAKDKESSTSGLATGSVIGYVAGGAFVAAAVISAVVIAPWKERPRKNLGLWVAPSLSGGAIGGSF